MCNFIYVNMSKIIFSYEWEKIIEHAYTIMSYKCANLWNQRFGYFNMRCIAEMKNKALVENISEFLSKAQVCQTCKEGNQRKFSFQGNQVGRAN